MDRQWLVRKTSSAPLCIACAAQLVYVGFRANKAHRSTHQNFPLQAIVHPRWDLSDRSFFGQSNLKHKIIYTRKKWREERDSLYIKEQKTTLRTFDEDNKVCREKRLGPKVVV